MKGTFSIMVIWYITSRIADRRNKSCREEMAHHASAGIVSDYSIAALFHAPSSSSFTGYAGLLMQMNNYKFGAECVYWTIWDLIPRRGKRFFFLRNVHTSSGAHPAPYAMVTRVPSLSIKGLIHEVDHSPAYSAKVGAEFLASHRARRFTAESEVNSDCMLTSQHLWCTGLFSLTLQ